MTTKEQIKSLRRGKTGADILSILDSLAGGTKQTEYVVSATLDESGYIITWDGRKVVF
jgi:hypothetical protein